MAENEAAAVPDPHSITRWYNEAAAGDSASRDQLLRAVYHELHRLAASYMRKEARGHLLQPTALISEMYLRLFGARNVPSVNNRGHFFALAATQMRRVLVEQARNRDKGGGAILVEENEALMIDTSRRADLLEIDEALRELAEIHPDAAQVVELRFFGGYTDIETAEIVGRNFARVRRDWEFARAWLLEHLDHS